MDAKHRLITSVVDSERLSLEATIAYQQMIGLLMYAMIQTKLDIMLTINILSRVLNTLNRYYYATAQWVLYYLKNIIDQGITFRWLKKAEVKDI